MHFSIPVFFGIVLAATGGPALASPVDARAASEAPVARLEARDLADTDFYPRAHVADADVAVRHPPTADAYPEPIVAQPIEARDPSVLEARDSCSLYYCIDNNFQGSCFNNVHACNECVDIGKKYDDKISSIGAGQGVCCGVWVDHGCNGAGYTVGYPGYNDVGSFNDRSSSFRCRKC